MRPAIALAQEASEHQLKAAFLFNFVKFIDWPETSFRENTGRMRLCVLGAEPLGAELERVATGKSVNGRSLEVVRLTQAEGAAHCQVLFLGASQSGALRKIQAELHGGGVLTVGDSPEFLHQGGVIRFLLLDNHVRFEVNLEAAEQAGLKISSKLLALAQNVRGGRGGGG
jgi:YfiR/HmsC-like